MSDDFPDQTDVLRQFELDKFLRTRTHIPGKVVSWDEKTKLASVQPAPRQRFSDGTVADLPQIDRVPVLHWSMGPFVVHARAPVGQQVMLACSDRALDGWMLAGDTYTPEDERRHALTDAVIIPGLYSHDARNPVQVGTDELYFGHRDASKLTFLSMKVTGTGETVLESGSVLLGEGATLGVARLTDPVDSNAKFDLWAGQVEVAIAAIPATVPTPPWGLTGTMGTISSASTKVKAE